MTLVNAKVTQDCCDVYDPSARESKEALRARLLEVAGLSELFKALGDATLTRVLEHLSRRALGVCDIDEIMEMSLPADAHRLRLLKALRIVKYGGEGKQVFYSPDDEHVVGLIRLAQEHFAEDR